MVCRLFSLQKYFLFFIDSFLYIEYVKHIHAPSIISQSMFSGAISLKCRHLRLDEKYKKGGLKIRKGNRKQNEKRKHFNNHDKVEHQNDNDLFDDIIIDDMDEN